VRGGLAAIYRSLISLSLLLTLLTVVLSAWIRLAEVGIGCDEWPQCYAVLDPAAEKKGITVLTEQGRDMGHRTARLAHRYIASTLGVFIVILFALSLRRQGERGTGIFVPSSILLITVFLSLLGYYTPTRDNPLITMGNLLGGMALLGLLWWMMQRNSETTDEPGLAGGRKLVLVALGLVILQMVLGGWSSANYASSSCPDILSCESPWLLGSHYVDGYAPWRSIELDSAGKVVQQAELGALTMTHRGFALLTAAYLAWLMRKLRPIAELRASAMAASAFSIGLIAVGVSMIWLDLPLIMVSLHNTLAACLLLGCVQLLHRLTPTQHPQASIPPEA
jgi:cytochrome c oxidase assembly protein subunit 15